MVLPHIQQPQVLSGSKEWSRMASMHIQLRWLSQVSYLLSTIALAPVRIPFLIVPHAWLAGIHICNTVILAAALERRGVI